ncbi:hypothetical protein EK0264_02435 [Epidermidibacterium keratini]|uniref:C4-type zinc ribbon domain-containing protein n=1 Tax=Epidermidibacterium keratini TaxID=1891644 RepID=A0A7L4YJF5_9ACTN|nr:C4-type zinc ribbon domain-containing protein [Epidermidibacterium keratini]QHB99259.1 hypothetical protein EK0264_02435 [Epidermidibacterium keratini]
MQADPTEQRRLLDLAAVDKNLAGLAHRRRTIPQLAELESNQAELTASERELGEVTTTRSDLTRDMDRLESDIDNVRNRQERNQQRLDSGAVSASKDLEALQHENATLRRRQQTLEDQEIELMEQAETLDAQIEKITAARDEIAARRGTAEGERDDQWAQLDVEIADEQTKRDTLAASFAADLLGLYDKIRATGVPGAALITQGRCGGCRMELSGSELAAVRSAAPNDVVRCESCRCIQVRTTESGL